MTRWYRSNLGIRISIMVSAVVFASIFTLVVFYLARDLQRSVNGEKAQLAGVAAAFSAAASSGLAHSDRREVLEALRGIRDLPDTKYVAVLDSSGHVFAQLGSAVSLSGRDGDAGSKSLLGVLETNLLITRVPVVSGGREIGTLEIDTDVSWLRHNYLRSLLDALLVGLAAVVLAALVANAAIRRLTRPLQLLTRELDGMDTQEALSLRFRHETDDEVGVLARAFNEAFRRIDERDRALREHRDRLEDTVELRTRDLKAATEEAERANAAKSDFLATMSHEIRTPMNGMLIMAELLATAPLSAKHMRYAEVISRSGRSLLNILNDILDFSKIEAGRLELEHVPFSIDSLVEDTVALFSAKAMEKKLSLGLYVAPKLASSFLGDPTRLGQVVSNLVNNALKFTERGGVTIRVVESPVPAPAGRQAMRIQVVDTGIGIPADKLDKIFENFAQADQSTTRRFGGTGLGLSISRRLVEKMGGELQVASEAGRGSRFFADIALEIDQACLAKDADAAEQPNAVTVLVLDGDPITREGTSEALAAWGLAVCDGSIGDGQRIAAIVARPQDLARCHDGLRRSLSGIPVILTIPYGEDSRHPSGWRVEAELPLPLKRSDVARLKAGLVDNDFGQLRAPAAVAFDATSLPDFSSLRVLAVDDTAVNREVLKECLSTLHVDPVLAAGGEEALSLFEDHEFDLVFMDGSMPGMDGFETTERLRAMEERLRRTRCRIVALTAHVTGPEAERWRLAGMDGYVAKPFTVAQLSAELAAVNARPAPTAAEVQSVEAEGVPLISSETVEMFQLVGKRNGMDMLGRIFGMFATQAPPAVEKIADATASGCSAGELAPLVHALKSMCNSSGAARMADLCERLESEAKTGKLPSSSSLQRLSGLLSETLEAMGSEERKAEATA